MDFKSWKRQQQRAMAAAATVTTTSSTTTTLKPTRSKRRPLPTTTTSTHTAHAHYRVCEGIDLPPEKNHLPTWEELRALEAARVMSQQQHSMARAKEMILQQAVAKQELERAKSEYKQKLKKSRLQQLESKAQRRIVKTLRREEEASSRRFLLGNGHHIAGSMSSLGAPHISTLVGLSAASSSAAAAAAATTGAARPHMEQWAATTRRVKCESASALVRTTLAFAQTLKEGALDGLLADAALPPPPPSGLFDQMLIVGLPLESLRDPIVSLDDTYTPQIVYTFPEKAMSAEGISDFCLPQGVTITPVTAESATATATTPGASASSFASEEIRYLSQLTATALEDIKEVLFVLSGGGADGSQTSYGMCLHLKRPYRYSEKVLAEADICYCFISRHPFLPLHLGVLRAIVRLHLSPEFWSSTTTSSAKKRGGGALTPPPSSSSTSGNNKPFYVEDLEQERQAILKITAVLERFAPVAIPNPGEEVEFSVFEGLPQALTVPTYFRRPPSTAPATVVAGAASGGGQEQGESDADTAPWIREWAVPLLLCTMSLENVLLVLFSMLTEMQVVVISKDLQLLSAAVLSWTNLLRPLGWAGPLIVTLPEKHSGYLESPVPFIIGMEELPGGFVHPKGMVVVYPDRDMVVFHPTEEEGCRQMVRHQIEWLMASLRETHREMSEAAAAARGGAAGAHHHHHHHQHHHQGHTHTHDGNGKAHNFMTPQRVISPAYRQKPLPFSFLSIFSSSTSAAAGTTGPSSSSSSSTTHTHTHTHTPPATRTTTNLDRRMIEEVIGKVCEHLTAIAEMALCIDLCYRPKRPVVDRRRSSIVEEKALDTDTRAWWDECLGEAGGLFMKRFMETQLYCNHRYSDKVRTRDVNRALERDSFSPHYRPLSSPRSRPKSPFAVEGGERDSGSSMMILPHQQGLTEVFQMAIFGALPVPSLSSSSSSSPFSCWLDDATQAHTQAHIDPSLRYKPCNGMCGGMSNTPDCTLLCLEAWQINLVQARRKEIVKEERLLMLGKHTHTHTHTNQDQALLVKHPHKREVPSQYRRRIRLTLGEKPLSSQKRSRIKGQQILQFREYKKYQRQQLRIFNQAAFIITRVIRRLAAYNRLRRMVAGVVLIQAEWRRYREEQKYREVKALEVLQGPLSRFSLRRRSQRSLVGGERRGGGGGGDAHNNKASFGSSGEGLEPRDSNASSDDSLEEGVGGKDDDGGGGGKKAGKKKQRGSRLWHYLMNRGHNNDSSSSSASAKARRPGTAPRGGGNSSSGGEAIASSVSAAGSSTHPPPAKATGSPAAPLQPSLPPPSSNKRSVSPVLALASPRSRSGIIKMATLIETGDLDEEEEGTTTGQQRQEQKGEQQQHGQERRASAAGAGGGAGTGGGAGSEAGGAAGRAKPWAKKGEIKPKPSPIRSPPITSSGGRPKPQQRMVTAVGSVEGSSQPSSSSSSSSSSTAASSSAVVSRRPVPTRRASPMLLARGPSFGRGVVAIEKGPLPLQDLRKGLRVQKFDRKGRPEKRVFLLEDKGSLAYSPRLAWRPATMMGRVSRSLLHGKKACHLDLADAFGGVDSSGKSPRIIMAITNRPPLLRPVGGGTGEEEARYLTFALSSASDPDYAYEFALVPGKGMTTEEAVNYYMSLLATLQTLCSTRGAPAHTQSPKTPKP